MHFTLRYHTCLEGRKGCVVLYFSLQLFIPIYIVHTRSSVSTAQTRELACTKVVIPQVCDRGEFSVYLSAMQLVNRSVVPGFNIKEVAHNMQRQVAQYVVKEGLVNSYDTWHGKVMHVYFHMCSNALGSKNVAKEVKRRTSERSRCDMVPRACG